jgi:hypothetical protein
MFPPILKEIPFRGLFGIIAVPVAAVLLFIASLMVFGVLFALPLLALEFLQKKLKEDEPVDFARIFRKELPLFAMIAVLVAQLLLWMKGVSEPIIFILF